MQIEIKPISVNKCWQGRRFMTKEYKQWRIDFGKLILLWKNEKLLKYKRIKNIPFEGWLSVKIRIFTKQFKRIDVDNLAKPILDALVENKVIVDDRFIKNLTLIKMPAEEEERIDIDIKKLK